MTRRGFNLNREVAAIIADEVCLGLEPLKAAGCYKALNTPVLRHRARLLVRAARPAVPTGLTVEVVRPGFMQALTFRPRSVMS